MTISIELRHEEGEKNKIIAISRDDDPSTTLIFDISTYSKTSESDEKFQNSQDKILTALSEEYEKALEEGQHTKAGHIREEIISKRDASEGAKLMDAIHYFIRIGMPNPTEQDTLYDFYRDCYTTIWSLDTTNINETIKKLRVLTRGIFQTLDLPAKARLFVANASLPMPNFENTGWREHDTPEMTFNRKEVQEITAMAIIAKLFCPIWGTLCCALGKIQIAAANNDFYCISIIEPAFLDSTFAEVYEKSYNYATVNTKKLMHDNIYRINRGGDKKENFDTNLFIIANNGYDLERFCLLMFGSVIVKRMVSYDLWKSSLVGEDRDPHFMVTACSRLRSTVNYALTRMNEKSSKAPRYEIDSNSSSLNEDNNITHLENQSPASKITMDIPIIAREAFKVQIMRWVESEGFDKEEFERTMEFYRKNQIFPNLFNIAIVTVVAIAPSLGASRNIDFLDRSESFTLACVYTMFVLIKRSHRYDPLIPMIAATTHCGPETNPTSLMANQLKKAYQLSDEYQEVIKSFPLSCLSVEPSDTFGKRKRRVRRVGDRQTVASQISRLVLWLTCNDHLSLTPDVIWRKLTTQRKVNRGHTLSYDDRFMDSVCLLFLEYSKGNKQSV